MRLSPRTSNRKLRVAGILITVLALVGALVISPVQIPVVLFKLSLVTLAAVASYWIDKILNPHVDNGVLANIVSSSDFNEKEREIAHELLKAAMIRRALITVAIVLGVCLGL